MAVVASTSSPSLSSYPSSTIDARNAAIHHGQHYEAPHNLDGGAPGASPRVPMDGLPFDEELPEPICGGCKNLIDEDSADAGVIHFATQLWHVDCFRCAKCRSLVTTDRDDILLLSDGQPICGQCNYSCQICNLPIMEEAIMTGDESYHASCFVCRACRTPIAELVFAKTSQGIYCMKCHNQRVARSRRHAEKKRAAAAAAAAAASATGTGKPTNMASSTSSIAAPTMSTSNSTSPMGGDSGSISEQHHHRIEASASAPYSTLSPHPMTSSTSSLTRPSSAGNGAKRPMNAPPPMSLRPAKKESERPSTGESVSPSEAATRLTPQQSSTLAKLEGEHQSPLLAGVFQQQAAQLKRNSESTTEGTSSHGHEIGVQDSAKHFDLKAPAPAPAPMPAEEKAQTPDVSLDATQGKVQVKRASRLNITGGSNEARRSRIYSFYDPEFASLMDSFGRMDEASKQSSTPGAEKQSPSSRLVAAEPDATADARSFEEPNEEIRDRTADDRHASSSSLNRLSETMQKSIQQARSGQVIMETETLETMLQQLDETRKRMKDLQQKYERMRRASQQAAQGFSSAREEYEQEVQARYDAEAEMLNLKRQLHIQASKLAESAAERKERESLQIRNQEIRSEIQESEKALLQLQIDKDVAMAEVAELIAAKDSGATNAEETIKRNLSTTLDAIRLRYQGEIDAQIAERDSLLAEIEELRQSRDVFAEESQTLNQRNDELSNALALLQRRVEHAQAAEKLAKPSDLTIPSSLNSQPISARSPNERGGGAFGFGFGSGGKVAAAGGGGSRTANESAMDAATATATAPIAFASPVPVTKVETGSKKFKWMKAPKLTSDSAKYASQHIASAFPGITPPLPPKGVNGVTHENGQTASPKSSISGHPQQVRPSHEHHSSTSTNAAASTNEIVVKEHLFVPFNVLRPIRCFACQKNMWGQSELKCTFCNQACHIRCLQNLPVSCNQPYVRSDDVAGGGAGSNGDANSVQMFGRSLTEQIRSEGVTVRVPLVVTKCVETVENQGMDYEGIYRKSGGTSQLKIITQLFEKGQPFNLDDRDRFNDVSAITSVLKNYFRELPEPLLTFELHEGFIACTESKTFDSQQKKRKMSELVHSLPSEHLDTLAFLIRHLHRVQLRSDENRMSSRNLGVVFGPTLMRSRDPTQEFAHMGGKAMTIEFMIDHPEIFD